MRILVIGATGFIGRHLVRTLGRHTGLVVTGTSRHAGVNLLALEACDAKAIESALASCDAVVNLVAGSARAIEGGARALVQALRAQARRDGRTRHLVHASSMAVYEGWQGQVDESTPLLPVRRWYARAKQASEACVHALAMQGHPVTMLRPGCVWGPGSPLWVERIAGWLEAGCLGDLGRDGDGWTHGVHVHDVCEAAYRALLAPPAPGQMRCLNLAAPDSPRWNTWFADLALSIGATPVQHLAGHHLLAQAWLAGPALALARRIHPHRTWSDPMSPQLLALWRSPLQMQAQAAYRELGLHWTPYRVSLAQAVAWWREHRATRPRRTMNTGLPIT